MTGKQKVVHPCNRILFGNKKVVDVQIHAKTSYTLKTLCKGKDPYTKGHICMVLLI